MLKGLLAFFLLFAIRVSAQYGTIESKISPQIDPEFLLFRKDSLNAVDTTKQGMSLAEYRALKNSTEMALYSFDRKKEHLAHSTATHQNTGPILPIEDDFLESFCNTDTLVQVHKKTAIHFDQEKYGNHQLIPGENNYLELKINTKECRCRDCWYCSRIFIKLPGEKLPVSMELDSTNCFFSVVNTWIIQPKETISYGKFYRDKSGFYLVFAYKNNPTDELYLLQTYWFAPEKIKELD